MDTAQRFFYVLKILYSGASRRRMFKAILAIPTVCCGLRHARLHLPEVV
ncbi:hypothetical protein [Undibacterium sp. Ren11W]